MGRGMPVEDGIRALLLAAVVVAVLLLARREKRKKSTLFAARRWGKDDAPHRLDEDDLRDISTYSHAKDAISVGNVDAVTWNDLDMDAVFVWLDRACSNAGEEVLYDMLHRTDASVEEWARRARIMAALERDEAARTQVRVTLRRLGRGRFHGAHSYLFAPHSRRVAHGWAYLALGLSPFAVAGLAALTTPHVLWMLIAVFVVNLAVYYRSGRIFMKEIAAVRHIAAVIETARKLQRCVPSELMDIAQEMERLTATLRPVRRYNALFAMQRMSDLDFLTDYLRIFFQLDMICLSRLSACFERENTALRRLYALVGEMDACMAVASLRASGIRLCSPTFCDEMRVTTCELVHPLVANPVGNDVRNLGSALITGSNASGKSTFMKALGINAILAQTVGICTAQDIRLPRAHVLTSMALRDNVIGGESYFVVEVRSLGRVLKAVQSGERVLCMIDEILRGTNTVERIAASSVLLEALLRENCLCVAATHDRELTHLLTGYRQLHFSETLTDTGMTFSYKLQEGPSASRNALVLMRQMGFPRQMTQEAERRAHAFEETGVWA